MKRSLGTLSAALCMLIAGATALFIPGCASFDNSVGVPLSAPQAGERSTVRLQFSIPGLAGNHATVRAATGLSAATVSFRLVLMPPPGATATLEIREQQTAVGSDGTVSAVFSDCPSRPAIAQVRITGGAVGGYSEYHGALDLTPGNNTLVVVPTGSGLTRDLLAHVAEAIANEPTLRRTAPAALVAAVQTALTSSGSANVDTVRSLTLERYLANTQLVTTLALSASSTGSLSAVDRLANVAWTRTGSEFWASGTLRSWPNFSQVTCRAILRQSVGNRGFAVWRHSSSTSERVSAVDTGSGTRVADLLFPGTVAALADADDGSVVVAGVRADNGAALVCRWAPDLDADASAATTGSGSGLLWTTSIATTTPTWSGLTAVQYLPAGPLNPAQVLVCGRTSDGRVPVVRLTADSGAVVASTDAWSTLALTGPTGGAVLTTATPINFVASVGTPAEVQKVEFYLSTTKIGEGTAPAFSFSWTNPTEGRYAVTACAVDTRGRRNSTKPVSIVVTATAPYALGEVRMFDIAAAGTSIIMPLATGTEEYGLALVTRNVTAGNYRVLGNGGGGTTLAALPRASSADDARQLRCQNQALADVAMRAIGRTVAPALRDGTRPSSGAIRPAIETVGQSVTFWAYSLDPYGGGGSTYSQRTGVLRRIGTRCKIFVDPNPSSRGLSAVSGASAITEQELDNFVDKFDNVIYNLITQGYGNTYDADGDGRVTIFFSPLYNQLGYAGIFDPTNFSSNSYSNYRDMFVIMCPDPLNVHNSWSHEEWFTAAAETIAHEFQHLANYVTRRIEHPTWAAEIDWLDEGLSVGAEARYRILIGDRAGEDRFSRYAARPGNFALTTFGPQLGNYGMVGLFMHYLYEQGGASTIRTLVQSPETGTANIDARFANRNGFRGVLGDWSAAVFAAGNTAAMATAPIDARYRYATDVGIDLNSVTTRLTPDQTFSGTLLNASMRFARIAPGAAQSGLTTMRTTLSDPDGGQIRCAVVRTK